MDGAAREMTPLERLTNIANEIGMKNPSDVPVNGPQLGLMRRVQILEERHQAVEASMREALSELLNRLKRLEELLG